jgi:hypothetical protein
MSTVTTLPGLLSGAQLTSADVLPVVRSASCTAMASISDSLAATPLAEPRTEAKRTVSLAA